MKIKKYHQFILEITGTELVGPIGPNYGYTGLKNKTISSKHTDVIYSDLDGKIYTIDDYQDLYNNYLKDGGKPLIGFNKNNIDFILNNI